MTREITVQYFDGEDAITERFRDVEGFTVVENGDSGEHWFIVKEDGWDESEDVLEYVRKMIRWEAVVWVNPSPDETISFSDTKWADETNT